jgi:RNA polymerase sigma-70 factor (ECF subfamily)
MGRLNDIALVTQVAVFHNKRAFDQLVKEYQSPVRRFFLTQTGGDSQLSDDLAQETFIKAYTSISQFRGTSSFLTWLIRIAYNVHYDYRRSTKPIQHTDELAPATLLAADRATASTQQPMLSNDINQALAQLNGEERACITLQMIDGYAIDEIADITGINKNTVKSHLRRGKEKMANYLRQNGYDR